MKKIIAIGILIMTLCGTAHAGQWFTWDKTNTKLHIPLTMAFALDYRQTLYNENRYYQYNGWGNNGEYHAEANKYLGKYPTRKDIQEYFAATYIITTAITYALPEKWSHMFQAGVIMLEISVVNGNKTIGAKIRF